MLAIDKEFKKNFLNIINDPKKKYQGGFKSEVQRLLMNWRIGLMGTSQGGSKDL